LDRRPGVIINPPDVPCWRDLTLADEVATHYSVHVKVDNDANAAGLAEHLWGAGRGYRNVFYATIGTGIGTGIVLDGDIFHGRTGSAGEGGHVSIDYRGHVCRCGKRGCIEILASGTAIARRAREWLAMPGVKSLILDLAGGDYLAITGEIIAKAYDAGDKFATDLLQHTIE